MSSALFAPELILADPSNNEPTPSDAVQEARRRRDGYLDALRRSPYDTVVLTSPLHCMNETCDVTLFHKSDTGDGYQESSFDNTNTLQCALEGLLDRSSSEDSEDWVVAITQDPSPDVIASLGGSLDVPMVFFASHATTGAIIDMLDENEEKDVSFSFRRAVMKPS